MFYILDEDNQPIKVENASDWANGFEEERKRVALDEINGVSISTVFLGLDHSHGAEKPILWETMCFSHNLDYDQYQERYSSYEEAVEGHKKCVEAVKANQPLQYRKTLKIKI